MMKIPVKFERVAAAFNEVARVRSCDSSGSEHSADLSSVDLSDMVNSFLEREIREQRRIEDVDQNEIDDDDDEWGISNSEEFESRDCLKNLFDFQNDTVKRSIHAEVENAYRELTDGDCSPSSPDFKRQLMARLRSGGFDAGLCKSKWEKNGRCTAGNYEYVDVNAAGVRYIIEVLPAEEFTIARPTGGYAALLEVFPQIFVGKPDELKQVVRLMSSAIRKSMKRVGIHVPPWRRHAYMQSKWFGSFKRTTSEISSRKVANFGGEQKMGFVPVTGVPFYCRQDFAAGAGASVRVGNLAAALNQKKMLL
ncbi:hypothetical protein CDL12_05997 [Handroanthus impetiginosus]|uniref:DUF506 domain-containing protein n=1 Tax=Handroanthus impetiginosus TaxID=429701 RepID=A0A2G9HV17_9LAMI|nr:hypothetical protein CDL12_05997 [Handroanthus impetiginosus]